MSVVCGLVVTMEERTSLLDVSNVGLHFPVLGGILKRRVGSVKAVDGVSFSIKTQESFGLVGESGCGKTTLGRVVLGLLKPGSGDVCYEGSSIFHLDVREMRELRRRMQMVYQDTAASLDPRMRIRDAIEEPLREHNVFDRHGRWERVKFLMERVGLDPDKHARRYPHEFSGGQRQRIVIARALALEPKLVVFDEPTSALDLSVQAQILNLIKDLHRDMSLTSLFISHDLSVINHMCDRVAVMYLGKLVELGRTKDIFENPKHPYTYALLSAVPGKKRDLPRILLKGSPPSPLNPPNGCRFHTRCPIARQSCSENEPELVEVGSEHYVACPYTDDLELKVAYRQNFVKKLDI